MGSSCRSPLFAGLCLLLLLGASSAEDIVGRIKVPVGISQSGVKLVLNGGDHWALSRADGTFVFHDVPPGIYSLDVLSVALYFPQIKVDVRAKTGGRVRALQYDYPGAPKKTIKYPLTIEPLQKVEYFEKRESFGLHTILRNPMMIMLAMTLFFAVIMPKMMSGMDPEEMKKMQEEMAQNQDPQNMLKGLFGGNKDDEDEDD
eukprot:g664.t1